MEKTKTLRHDFRQHLRVIAGLSEAGRLDELRSYLKDYAGETSEEHAPLCANAALDAIAGYYDAAARRAAVPISWQIELPQTLPLPDMYGKNLTFKTGGVDGFDTAEILRLIECGQLDTTPLITHIFSLNEIEAAYDLFEKRRDGVMKVAITPPEK